MEKKWALTPQAVVISMNNRVVSENFPMGLFIPKKLPFGANYVNKITQVEA